jgi:hypothetical protein
MELHSEDLHFQLMQTKSIDCNRDAQGSVRELERDLLVVSTVVDLVGVGSLEF